MKQEITRKDGIVYERQEKKINLDCSLNFRFTRDNSNKLKEIANRKGIKFNAFIRNILEEYINNNY